MPLRRLASATLALVAMIALTGCDPAKEQPAPARSGAPDPSAATSESAAVPDNVAASESAAASGSAAASDSAVAARAALVAAAARLADDTARVRVSIAGQMSMTGVIDPRSQHASMRMDMGQVDDGTQAEIRQLGPDVWVRLQGPIGTMFGADDQWLHVAAADLPATSNFKIMTGDDPAGVRAVVDAATEVERTGANSFAGVLDLTRTSKYTAQTLASLGSKASAVPFTAKIDQQGRLIQLTTKLSAIVSGAGSATTRFSDFGVAVEVQRPPADETTELPSDLKSVIDA
jgi:hypothetical protein